MLNLILFLSMFFIMAFILFTSYIDWSKPRKIKKNFFISFIIPCYNKEDTLKDTIKSIYDSYDNFELIVINDKSTDNSYKKILESQKEYGFSVINNEKNLGKAESINLAYKQSKGELIFVIDADTILNKEALNDILLRFTYNEKVGGVSCSLRPTNKGFLPLMQEFEYNMYALSQYSHNIFSTISLWGGCLAVRKTAFEQAGLFSTNTIIEDMELACKLNKLGWKVESSFCFAKTLCPDNLKSWYKQKIRWSSGMMQCLIKYPLVFFKNPIYCLFFLFQFFLLFLFIIYSFKFGIFILNFYNFYSVLEKTGIDFVDIFLRFKLVYGSKILAGSLIRISFLLFNIPYIWISLNKKKFRQEKYKFLYIFPFSFIYLPAYYFITIIGLMVGIKRSRKLKEGERAW